MCIILLALCVTVSFEKVSKTGKTYEKRVSFPRHRSRRHIIQWLHEREKSTFEFLYEENQRNCPRIKLFPYLCRVAREGKSNQSSQYKSYFPLGCRWGTLKPQVNPHRYLLAPLLNGRRLPELDWAYSWTCLNIFPLSSTLDSIHLHRSPRSSQSATVFVEAGCHIWKGLGHGWGQDRTNSLTSWDLCAWPRWGKSGDSVGVRAWTRARAGCVMIIV